MLTSVNINLSIFPLYLFPGNEKPFYAIGIPDAKLNMIFVMKASAGVKLFSFDKNTSHGIKRPKLDLTLHIMQIFNDSAV